jgi:hypothetical protein
VQGQPTKEESVTKLKRIFALALTGGALAVGVPAALAAGGGGDDAGTTTQPSGPAFIQEEGEQNRPDRGQGGPGDCPEKDGQGGSGESGSGSGSGYSAPDSGSTTEL